MDLMDTHKTTNRPVSDLQILKGSHQAERSNKQEMELGKRFTIT
jgi:hypothetical protein